jgi:hypothetical protein
MLLDRQGADCGDSANLVLTILILSVALLSVAFEPMRQPWKLLWSLVKKPSYLSCVSVHRPCVRGARLLLLDINILLQPGGLDTGKLLLAI